MHQFLSRCLIFTNLLIKVFLSVENGAKWCFLMILELGLIFGLEFQGEIGLGKDLITFVFEETFEIGMIFNSNIFFVLISFSGRRDEDSFAFRDFDDTVVEVLVFEVVVLFEFGLGAVGTIKDEFFLF